MIQSFANKQTAAIFIGRRAKGLPGDIQQRAREKLKVIHAALLIDDLRNPPGNMLEKLSGSRQGQWSILINNQWRIYFEWHTDHAHEVEITDYH